MTLEVLDNPAPHAVKVEMPDWAVSTLWREDVRHIALFGGRGGGKSHAVARALLLQAAAKYHRVLCCREIQNSTAESVHRILVEQIELCGLGDKFTVTDHEIRGPHGSMFIFAGLRTNVSKIKSMEGITDVWVEEAQTISQPSIDVLLPTIRAPGSRFFWTWNPGKADDPIEKMFRGGSPPPRTVLRRINYNRNPWFPDELRESMEHDKQRDYDKFRHVWLGQFNANSKARVFNRWQVADFDTPSNATFRFGLDFGFSVDPTVLVRCWIGTFKDGVAVADDTGTHLFVDGEAWEKACEMDKLPQLLDQIPGSREWQIVADNSRPETISYLRNHGFPKMAPSVKGAGSVVEGVEFMKGYDIVVHSRCEHVAEELATYSYKTDPRDPDTVLPVLEDKNNHCMDAARYALGGIRRAVAAAKKQSVNASYSPPTLRSGWSR